MGKYYNFLISNLIVFLYFLNKNNWKKKNYKFEVIVFSFNRALQLESLIKSLIFNLDGNIRINILYKTDKHTNNLYEVLKKQFIKNKNINFIYQERNLKNSLLKLIKTMNDKNSSNKSYDFEPSEEEILNEIIPKNIAIQIHTALLENLASEQGSRMTAMDNATRNANDMIVNLTLFYNRSRQALITKELIEIISGAEAV